MTVVLAWAAAGAFSLGLLLGGFVAWDWLAPKHYQKGFTAGIDDEHVRSVAARDKLELQLKADQLEVQAAETARVREVNRIREAAVDVGRQQFHEDRTAAGVELERVLGRLRAAETATRSALRRANNSGGVPGNAGTPAGAEKPTAGGLLSERDRADLAALIRTAEEVRDQYQLSLTQFPERPKDNP